MADVLDIAGWILLSGGGALIVIGSVGVVRFPDVFTRSHAAGVTDTGGAALILLGLMTQIAPGLVTAKLLLILVFIFFTSPTATFALIHSAFIGGEKPLLAHDLVDRPAADEEEEQER